MEKVSIFFSLQPRDAMADDNLNSTLKRFDSTLQHLASQMDTLTQTCIILEQRLSLIENKVAEMASNHFNTSH